MTKKDQLFFALLMNFDSFSHSFYWFIITTLLLSHNWSDFTISDPWKVRLLIAKIRHRSQSCWNFYLWLKYYIKTVQIFFAVCEVLYFWKFYFFTRNNLKLCSNPYKRRYAAYYISLRLKLLSNIDKMQRVIKWFINSNKF